MSWDEGLMGTCPHCGLRVHAMYEDRATTNPVWTYCSSCQKAGVTALEDVETLGFWNRPHRCSGCAGALVRWDTRKCPRCHKDVKWEYILAAD